VQELRLKWQIDKTTNPALERLKTKPTPSAQGEVGAYNIPGRDADSSHRSRPNPDGFRSMHSKEPETASKRKQTTREVWPQHSWRDANDTNA
jgi:hypothetical protein